MAQAIIDIAMNGDVVLCMGAGSIAAVPQKVVDMLQISELLSHEGKPL